MGHEVAVLVLNYNGREHLEGCFAALSQQTYKQFDAILVDNNSQDDSCQLVANLFPAVQVMKMPQNYGIPAYNRAIDSLDHDFVALLNNDTAVDPKWLEELVLALSQDPEAAACTSKMVFMDSPSVINHAGGAITWLGLGYDIGFGKPDGPEFGERRYVGSFCGGAALLKRKVFQDLGGFDDRYFAYFEDVDLSWRMSLQGYKVLYVPTALVRHKFGGSFGPRGSILREYLCERNRWANVVKNAGAFRVVPLLMASFGFHVMKVVEHSLLRRPALALAMLRGLRDALRMLPHLLKERRRIQETRRVSDRQLEAEKVVVPLFEAARERLRLGWARYPAPTIRLDERAKNQSQRPYE